MSWRGWTPEDLARVLGWTMGALGILAVLAFALLVRESFWKPSSDTDDPDYAETERRLAAVAEQLRAVYDRGEPRPPGGVTLDLSHLNGGPWATACLFGGYSYPSQEIANLGDRISAVDAERLGQARERGFRLGEVEEFEAMVAYIDGAGDARFTRFQHGIGTLGQHFKKCTDRLAPVMLIDDEKLVGSADGN